MRRLTHYDYWQDKVRKCILCDSGADMILYGMGEKSIIRLCQEIENGRAISDIHDIPQTVFLVDKHDVPNGISEKNDIVLHSHEECLKNKRAQAENFRHIEEEANKIHAQRLLQLVGSQYVVVNPPKSERYPLKSGISVTRFTSFKILSFDRHATNLPWCAEIVQNEHPPKHP